MRCPDRAGFRRVQRGAGLFEVIVGMVIGLVLLIALAYFFVGGRQVNRTTEDLSRIQESGRIAIELMGRAIRQAGYRTNPDVLFSGTTVTGTDGAAGAPDTVTVQYEAQQGGEANCVGTNVAAGALVTFLFAVDNVASPPTLTCNGTVVVDNIEDMQITYGIDADKDGNIELYKTAPTAAEFAQVVAVRVTLLVRGPQTNTATGTQTFTFNGASVTKTDGYLRRVYTATYAVRNQEG